MIRVNEQSTAYLNVTFLNGSGEAVAPTSVTYKVTDSSSGTVVRNTTSISAASTVTISLDSVDTRMVDSTKSQEDHIVTVTGSYGGTDYARDEFTFTVVNLVGV